MKSLCPPDLQPQQDVPTVKSWWEAGQPKLAPSLCTLALTTMPAQRMGVLEKLCESL
jgi:hypothetical protein